MNFALGAVCAILTAGYLSLGDNQYGRLDAATLASSPKSDSPAWLTDFAAARQKARADHKPMLLDFTGSDWCGWCMKLDHEVLSTPEFRDYAAKNLVLVKVDFPMHQTQPPAEQRQNAELQNRFQVQGYPTLVVLDSNGRQLGTLGYMPGGPKPFISQLAGVTKG